MCFRHYIDLRQHVSKSQNNRKRIIMEKQPLSVIASEGLVDAKRNGGHLYYIANIDDKETIYWTAHVVQFGQTFRLVARPYIVDRKFQSHKSILTFHKKHWPDDKEIVLPIVPGHHSPNYPL